MNAPFFLALSEIGFRLLEPVARSMQGAVAMPAARAVDGTGNVASAGEAIREAFIAGRPIVAVMATGSLVRILAPCLSEKKSEPPVIAVAEDGSSVVPVLGGHHGGNDLARQIAERLDGHAAVTTAGDLRFGVALDQPPEGWVLANPENAKRVMADLLAGNCAQLIGRADWLSASTIPFSGDGAVRLIATDKAVEAGPRDLIYHPKAICLGMGCERGAAPKEAIDLAESILAETGYAPKALSGLYSIDLKADETALHAVAAHFGVAARFFTADRLEQEKPRLETPSDVVFAEVGCHGVAEGAALAASGSEGKLVLAKRKSQRVTAALARCGERVMEQNENACRPRGMLFVVGIGPGMEAWRSPEVTRMISASTDLVGYSLYLDLIEDISKGKVRHDYDLGREEDRVRHAMELSGEGKSVALVCSGDAGIYAMATLVFELIDNGGLSDAAMRIEIAVSPGISALQAAAARAGAPLGHDFCTISLSDLLTPWAAIQKRVKAAAEGDFVIAFYNPVSKRRRTQLAYARDVLLEHRPADTPVILATNLGRPEEKVRAVPLSGLEVDDVDMLTVVVVGSSDTRTVKTGDGRTWVYTPRGYSAKDGTGIESQERAAS
jgi:cobalt-precorrin 5A hydrolase/precorrin-3B C17-methyltransferase